MNKRIFALLLNCVFCLNALLAAEGSIENITVTSPGTLQDLILDIESSRIDYLAISGPINAADVKTLRNPTGKLLTVKTLDISGISLVPGDEPYYSYTSGISSITNTSITEIYYLSDDPHTEEDFSWSGLGVGQQVYKYYRNDLSAFFLGVNAYETIILPEREELGSSVFSSSSVSNVILPANLKKIGYAAFRYTKNLKSLKLPAGIDSIPNRTFYDSGLETLEYEGQFRYVGNEAFYGTKLTKLPDLRKLEFLGDYAFSDVPLTGTLDLSQYPFDYIGPGIFQNNLFTEIILPDRIKEIWENALSSSGSKTVKMNVPSALIRLGRDALPNVGASTLRMIDNIGYFGNVAYKCNSDIEIDNLIFRSGTVSISSNFYVNAKKSEKGLSVSFPESLLYIGDERNGYRMFSNYASERLKSVTLPPNLIELGNSVFYGCANLKKVDFNEGLERIGSQAFRNCYAIEEITLPNSLEYIGENAFYDCRSITELTIPENCTGFDNSFVCTMVSRVNLNAKNFGGNLRGFSGLSHVVIGKTVEVIPKSFLPSTVRRVRFEPRDGRQLELGEAALRSEALVECNLFDEVELTEIPDGLFNGCELLTIPSLPQNIEKIGSYAFSKVKMPSNLIIPESCRSIGTAAFLDCTSIEQVQLPEKLENLEVQAFYGTSISSVEIPTSLSSKLMYAKGPFGPSLKQITFKPGTKEIAAYLSDTSVEELYIPDGVEKCNIKCYNGSLRGVSFPVSCLKVEGKYSGSRLEYFGWRIPENYVFEGDASENYIGDDIFSHSLYYAAVVIPEGIGRIGEDVFYKTQGEVLVPTTVTEIGKDAFYRFSGKVYMLPPNPPSCDQSSLFGATVCVANRVMDMYKAAYPNVILQPIEVPAMSATLDKYRVYGELNEIVEVSANVEPYLAYYTTEWSIEDSNGCVEILSGQNSDKVRLLLKKDGEATLAAKITSFDGSWMEAFCYISVNGDSGVKVESVGLWFDDTLWHVGRSFDIYPQITPDDATYKEIIYESSDPRVAKVSDEGHVEMLKPGEAVITVTVINYDGSEVKANALVRVFEESTVKPEDISVTPNYISGTIGEKYSLLLSIEPADSEYLRTTWESMDPSVASVNENGEVELLNIGSTEIWATVRNFDTSSLSTCCIIEVADDSGIDFIHDYEQEVRIFNTAGTLLYEGIYSEAHLEKGLYIIIYDGRPYKKLIK